MVKLKQIYKCEICGNIVEVLREGAGELVCCGQPMKLQNENAVEAAEKKSSAAKAMADKPAAAKAMADKHAPTLEKTETGHRIKVGSTAHPMEEEHYIEWIELIAGGKVYRQSLGPGDKPIAEFCVAAEKAEARAYCNLHGLWKS